MIILVNNNLYKIRFKFNQMDYGYYLLTELSFLITGAFIHRGLQHIISNLREKTIYERLQGLNEVFGSNEVGNDLSKILKDDDKNIKF